MAARPNCRYHEVIKIDCRCQLFTDIINWRRKKFNWNIWYCSTLGCARHYSPSHFHHSKNSSNYTYITFYTKCGTSYQRSPDWGTFLQCNSQWVKMNYMIHYRVKRMFFINILNSSSILTWLFWVFPFPLLKFHIKEVFVGSVGCC